MSKSNLRIAILLLGLFTAVVHLVVLNVIYGAIDPLFTPNGIGYLVLLYAVLRPPAFLAGQRKLVHYAFMLFTAATIGAFFYFGGPTFDTRNLGYVTKVVEVLLIVALWQHMNAEG